MMRFLIQFHWWVLLFIREPFLTAEKMISMILTDTKAQECSIMISAVGLSCFIILVLDGTCHDCLIALRPRSMGVEEFLFE